MKEYVMGNASIALSALKAGINMACGYPGTPSSEIIETIAKFPMEGLHIEWSVNEKSALEVAAAAAYSGARAIVTMKQVGLNVASDPLMSLAYVGVEGGLVVVVADDPGPISSQTEQDTRRFADFARIPVFDPVSPEEAFEMIQDAFELSEKYKTPVIFRPTTRICHAYATIEIPDMFTPKRYEGFSKDAGRFVIFPKLSHDNHGIIEERNIRIGKENSSYRYNTCEGKTSSKVVLAGGVSYMYAREFLKDHQEVRLIKVATAFPFPEEFLLEKLEGAEEILCLEELSPYLEEQLLKLCGKHHLPVSIYGKLTGHVPAMGELAADTVRTILEEYLDIGDGSDDLAKEEPPMVPSRPPVLCAGCPHRASFYAVKRAMEGERTYYCGDIGCYTLGNAKPLDMVDTCLCMGAGVTMAQGFSHIDRDGKAFAFIGDSTFFASGITGVINAVFNEADITVCILDNSTTAMTGHQPHPGTGRNMMGHSILPVGISRVLEGIGLHKIVTVDPFDLDKAVDIVRECANLPGVKAVIFKSPCIALTKTDNKCRVSEACIGCGKCMREIGCPALSTVEGRVTIDATLCRGCGLCAQICPVSAITDATYSKAE